MSKLAEMRVVVERLYASGAKRFERNPKLLPISSFLNYFQLFNDAVDFILLKH